MTVINHIAFAARDRKRLQDIGIILARFGLDDLLQRLNPGLLHPFMPGQIDSTAKTRPLPDRACAALEELGPSFVKLGQILAARADLLPPEWIAAFEKLHSGANPVPHAMLLPQLIEDLGGMPEDIFSIFDPNPVALIEGSAKASIKSSALARGFL